MHAFATKVGKGEILETLLQTVSSCQSISVCSSFQKLLGCSLSQHWLPDIFCQLEMLGTETWAHLPVNSGTLICCFHGACVTSECSSTQQKLRFTTSSVRDNTKSPSHQVAVGCGGIHSVQMVLTVAPHLNRHPYCHL